MKIVPKISLSIFCVIALRKEESKKMTAEKNQRKVLLFCIEKPPISNQRLKKMFLFTLRLLCFFFFFFFLQNHQGALGRHQSDECTPTRCSGSEPVIQYPFWLKDHQPEYCGASPKFSLSCSATNHTILVNSPFSGHTTELQVSEIDYWSQWIQIFLDSPPPSGYVCLHDSSPFRLIIDDWYGKIALFQCPTSSSYDLQIVSCLSNQNHTIVAVFAFSTTTNTAWLRACKKMESLGVVELYPSSGITQWEWSLPYIPGKDKPRKNKFNKYSISGSFLVAAIVIAALCFGYRTVKSKRDDELMVERFLKDYKALKPTRFTYAEIKKITNNFIDKLGQGGYGTVYKGKLSNDVHVAAKILNNSSMENGDEFLNEVATIGTIHHINIVRLVGYCADGFRRALVYEYLPNESLEKFISTPDQRKRTLGWDKLQEIALGIAKGIEYLHHGCAQQILHFDIKPHNILLDDNFNPKVADFGLAKLCSKYQSAVSMTIARGTIGYIAPEVISRNFGKVSHKSDVYSFGMLLLEMAGGRKNPEIKEENGSEIYFPEWIYNHLSRNIGVSIEIEDDQGGQKIVTKLLTVGLWCIQWTPGDRPSMKTILQMLEGDGDTDLPMPPNPFVTKKSAPGGTFNSLEVISESESESLD